MAVFASKDCAWRTVSFYQHEKRKDQTLRLDLFFFGAGKRTWTSTKLPPLEPESSASANSAIPAYEVIGKSEKWRSRSCHYVLSFDFYTECGLRVGSHSLIRTFDIISRFLFFVNIFFLFFSKLFFLSQTRSRFRRFWNALRSFFLVFLSMKNR